MPKPVKFRHYKGTVYTLIAEAEHTETRENLVIYVSESGKVWARPESMFYGNVPRFQLVDDE